MYNWLTGHKKGSKKRAVSLKRAKERESERRRKERERERPWHCSAEAVTDKTLHEYVTTILKLQNTNRVGEWG